MDRRNNIHPTLPNEEVAGVCSEIREDHSSPGGDGTNVSPAVLDFGKAIEGVSVTLAGCLK